MLIRSGLLMFFIAWGIGVAPSSAAERALSMSFGGEQRRVTAAELLARPDAAFLTVPDDVSYRRAMTYRAVPLLGLIGDVSSLGFSTIEARASDGFVSQVPASLVAKGLSGGAVAWVAVEDPAAPWPNLPGREVSGGPFYLVWEHPRALGRRRRAVAVRAYRADWRRGSHAPTGLSWRSIHAAGSCTERVRATEIS